MGRRAAWGRRTRALLACWAFSSLGAPAGAALLLQQGNIPGVDQQNVLFSNDTFGASIQGATNQSGDLVNFASPSQFLLGNANGQATINAKAINDENSADVLITDDITITMDDPQLSMTAVVFNLANTGNLNGSGNVELTVDGFDAGNVPMVFVVTMTDLGDPISIGSGSNFYTLTATAGMRITSLTISPTAGSGYVALQQVRISVGSQVPEPAAAGLAAILAGVATARRRRS